MQSKSTSFAEMVNGYNKKKSSAFARLRGHDAAGDVEPSI